VLAFIAAGMMVVYASLALHGWWGKAAIPWAARAVLAACSLSIIHPNPLIQWPATLVGGVVVIALWKFLAPAVAAALMRAD